MDKEISLLDGDIKKALMRMSLPLMGITFVQMTYNLVDMFWLGRYSADAVAAVGTAGLLNYIGNSMALVGRVGAATWISRSYGQGKYKNAVEYSESGILVNIFIALAFTILVLLGKQVFLGFFTLNEEVTRQATEYINVIAMGFIITFLNPMFAVSFNSIGNSVTPFKVSIIGLIANTILNPIFIFGLDMGAKGAAIATVVAQTMVLITFLIFIKKTNTIFNAARIFKKHDLSKIKDIVLTGWPAALQSTFQAGVATMLNKFISNYGSMPIAVYSIGVQIESICWMTADGFAIAVTAFMGQNLGARNFDRIKKGYKESMKIFALIGIIATVILMFFGGQIFSLFMPGDLEAIAEGRRFAIIMAVAETFMALEIGANGSFNGLGLTKFPAITSLTGNFLRIPISLILMSYFGIAGVWASVSITMIIKGIFSMSAYHVMDKRTNGFRSLEKENVFDLE